MFNRRRFLTTSLGAGAALSTAAALPAWAQPARMGNLGIPQLTGTDFHLTVDRFTHTIDGKRGKALGVNGTVPGPLIRFREGDDISLMVHNKLDEATSVHWHGLLVPFQMDGVPGVSFPGIPAKSNFTYRFSVPQNGTYWYHSHSGLQEQMGHYGPIIVDPKGADPVQYDREYVLVLSDWTFDDPHRIFSVLKKNAEALNRQQVTAFDDVPMRGMWNAMRMNPRDLADVTGASYTYAINGHATSDNFDMIAKPGERVRLRIINGSAMSIFNVRIPGLPMTVVAADGLNVQPVETDEFQIGAAETYDVIVSPTQAKPFAFVAESIDRSGQVVATLAPRPGMRAVEPALRPVPMLSMADMGMDHGDMDHGSMSHDGADKPAKAMDHKAMGHGPTPMSGPNPHGPSVQVAAIPTVEADIERGVGVANVVATPMSRLDEPGIGLEDVPHRTLTYSQLRSLAPNEDTRPPEREVVVHLTSNMERYMWSFDGVKFSEVTESIKFFEGERVRLTLVNNTMMPHPIHLHGMFFDLVNGRGEHMPRKHTVIVKPAERVSVDVTAEHVGDWAFHCHLLYHMHAGMMQVVSVMPTGRDWKTAAVPMDDHSSMNHSKMDHSTMDHGMPGHGSMSHGPMSHDGGGQ